MADTVTSPAFNGEKSVYDVFKNSSYSNGINATVYKYMFGKALKSQLMVKEMIGSGRKKLYKFSEMVEVTKKARMDNESGTQGCIREFYTMTQILLMHDTGLNNISI
eukprot:2624935-Ditylum_brightwellii.AAC.1